MVLGYEIEEGGGGVRDGVEGWCEGRLGGERDREEVRVGVESGEDGGGRGGKGVIGWKIGLKEEMER